MTKATNPTAPDFDAAFAEAAAGRRVKVKRGRQAVAVVPLADLEWLERLDAGEDRLLVEASLAALAEQEASGEPGVSLAEIRARYNL